MSLYEVKGGCGDYKIVATNIKDAVDVYYKIVGTEYIVTEVKFLFSVHI